MKILLLLLLFSVLLPFEAKCPPRYGLKVIVNNKKTQKKNDKKKKKIDVDKITVNSSDYHKSERRMLSDMKKLHDLQIQFLIADEKKSASAESYSKKINSLVRSLKRDLKDIPGLIYYEEIENMHNSVGRYAKEEKFKGKSKREILSSMQQEQYEQLEQRIVEQVRERKLRMSED